MKNHRFTYFTALIAVLIGAYWAWQQQSPTEESGNAELIAAYQQQRSDVQVLAQGQVIRILNDDNQGSRHQRFIVEVAPQHTVLIAHNIDLAPRVPVKRNDQISFYGEYEWNDRGGVVHWTHHDPRDRHVDGWIEHQGRRYQ